MNEKEMFIGICAGRKYKSRSFMTHGNLTRGEFGVEPEPVVVIYCDGWDGPASRKLMHNYRVIWYPEKIPNPEKFWERNEHRLRIATFDPTFGPMQWILDDWVEIHEQEGSDERLD